MNIPLPGGRLPSSPAETAGNAPPHHPIARSVATSEAGSTPASPPLSLSPHSSQYSSSPIPDAQLQYVAPALASDAQQRHRLQPSAQGPRSRRMALDSGLHALDTVPTAVGNTATASPSALISTSVVAQLSPVIAPIAASGVTAAASIPATPAAATTAVLEHVAAAQSQSSNRTSGMPGWHDLMHRGATQIAAPMFRSTESGGRGNLGFAAMVQSQGMAVSLPPALSMPSWNDSAPSSPDGDSNSAPFRSHRPLRGGRAQPSNRRTARVIRDLMQPSPLMLADIATQWSNVGDTERAAALHARWNNFSTENGAQVFSEFLIKLTGTVNADNGPFKQQTADLLAQLDSDPVLRQHVFAISVDASSACEDRVSLAFVTMLAAARAAKFRQTTFASDADAIAIQRQFHRLDLLHDLAHTIVTETRNGEEELETHLHLLTKHVGALQLAGTVPEMDMRWDSCSAVSVERDAEVVPTIKRRENEQFARWLSRSPSWLDYIEHEDKAHFDAMHEARDTLFEQQFQARLDIRLAATGVNQTNDPTAWADAERGLGKVVSNELIDEVHLALTIDFLTARSNGHLLAPYWPEPDSATAAEAPHAS